MFWPLCRKVRNQKELCYFLCSFVMRVTKIHFWDCFIPKLMSVNCTVSHNDPIKSLGTWTAEELLILSKCQCDKGGCHTTVTSPALWLAQSLWPISCTQLVPHCVPGLPQQWVFISHLWGWWVSLFEGGWWQSFVYGHCCILIEIFWGFLTSWRGL